MLGKAIPNNSPTSTPTWEGSYSVILPSAGTVKVTGVDTWNHHTWIKSWNPPRKNHKDHPTPAEQKSQENSQWLECQYTLLER